mmetsp:Transcript_19045/g.27439  ORF Transcript_19045/g.27439 Transcript_19045/m.27439 type:complete len:80 (+) Transcript_19045:629-868(+)
MHRAVPIRQRKLELDIFKPATTSENESREIEDTTPPAENDKIDKPKEPHEEGQMTAVDTDEVHAHTEERENKNHGTSRR